ncbi:hypothetical protein R1flu_003774 [Riccia fluitans]|uniref:Uncharacterized protein n=1 Tax=Riccia fluitans TaxID=41844 RepID=A0ABD1YDL1_9MARC
MFRQCDFPPGKRIIRIVVDLLVLSHLREIIALKCKLSLVAKKIRLLVDDRLRINHNHDNASQPGADVPGMRDFSQEMAVVDRISEYRRPDSVISRPANSYSLQISTWN